ncbi:efflux RND transporter periplasmic adaptor subunit [Caproiciproducens galactitolivorans]|uniref:Efflux RND transporter periplasmic adaptor subunit n=1 Tax=Caproiciproducens galactitolivorans TaxID=642589 RepID=A0ABT4BTB4_9FIRM|nr:efflux RND transporter periplasmic adaptor subunit [Caproiciproducens galactitolivorans]MCY1714142.1 efflux RND transporter periplasmic adaptor subunit [Caproiciproducens galactitolivorans]
MKLNIFSKLKFKKIKKKKLFIFLGVVVVVAVGFFMFQKPDASKQAGFAKTGMTELTKGSLRDTVNVSGTVKSKTSKNVYTTLAFPVKEVKVEVGDKVKAGDVLAVLDASTLDKDVESAKYSTDSLNTSNKLTLDKAKSDYDNALHQYNNNMNSELINAKSAVDTAQQDLKSEQSTYNYDKYMYSQGQLSKMALDQEQIKLQNAQNTYDKAVVTLKATQNKVQQDLQAAKNTYEAALAKSKDKSQEVLLEKQQKNLQDSIIKAPVDGTVTASNATVGSTPTGAMFTIDDTNSLKVNAEVKEFDISRVTVGKKVDVKLDATGEKVFPGVVSKIAPAATASTQGTSNVTFSTEITINDKSQAIKIGMKARMNIIINERNDIYTVPYDAVQYKEDGSAFVYTAVKEKDVYKAKELPVKTGLANDISIEISGSGIKDGVKIVSNPENIQAGSILNL